LEGAMPAANSAEQAYVFRHAVLREAAYQLQPPQDRARLHAKARLILDVPGLEPRDAECVALHAIAAAQDAAMDPSDRAVLFDRAGELLEIAGRHEADNLRFLGMLRLSRLGAELPGNNEARLVYFLAMQEHALVATGRGAGSRQRLEALLPRARACGSSKLLRVVRNTCAYVRMLDSDFAGAEILYREQLADVGDGADEGLAAIARNNLAVALKNMGRHVEAMAIYEEAAEKSRVAGSTALQGQALDNIGSLLLSLGKPVEALEFHRRALALLAPDGPSMALALAQSHTADALSDLPDKAAEAESMYRQALATQIASGHAGGRGPILNNLGNLYSATGRTADALACFEQALQWAQESGNRHSLVVSATNLSDTSRLLGKFRPALEVAILGLATMAGPDQYFAPMLWLIRACAEAGIGQRQAAGASLHRARETRPDLETAPEFKHLLTELASTLGPLGAVPDDARD